MLRVFIGLILLSAHEWCLAQNQAAIDTTSLNTQKKVTAINPGFELEIPITQKTALNLHGGIGYGGGYPELTFGSGALVLIAPFIDVQSRLYINRFKRLGKGKNIENNSGSFLMARGLVRGKAIHSTFIRTSNLDFAVGLGYGFQNYKNRLGWSVSIAPYFYFDDKGNAGFFPFIPEINVGYLIK